MNFATDDACVDHRDQPYCETKQMWVLLKIGNDPLNKKHTHFFNVHNKPHVFLKIDG